MRSIITLTVLLLAGSGMAAEQLPAIVTEPDPHLSLTDAERVRLARVIQRNQSLLGARSSEFCQPEDAACRKAVAAASPNITTPIRVQSVRDSAHAGLEWPGDARLRDARIVEALVVFRRGPANARREVPLLVFTLITGDTDSACIFPVEHWEWSGMTLPERFAMAPIGICDEEELSVAGLLRRILAGDTNPWAIRFLSREEGRAWATGNPEALRRQTQWSAGHPYAKYFFLESMRWWRGGDGRASAAHAAAVRLPALPVAEIEKLSQSGDAFLDLYEDGAQIEFTIVSRDGLVEVLSWEREALLDTSAPDAAAPRLETAAPESRP